MTVCIMDNVYINVCKYTSNTCTFSTDLSKCLISLGNYLVIYFEHLNAQYSQY